MTQTAKGIFAAKDPFFHTLVGKTDQGEELEYCLFANEYQVFSISSAFAGGGKGPSSKPN